ncbi:MAG: hypothetical protein ABJ308_13440 [Halieaceae bacterium]
MSYFWVALLIFAALSPLIAMRPSKRQLRIARLREAAALNGLYVELKSMPTANSPTAHVAYYACRRQRADGPGTQAGLSMYAREEDGWRALRGAWPARNVALLSQLPASISLVCEDVAGVGVFWDESGSVEDLEPIADTLRGLLGRVS